MDIVDVRREIPSEAETVYLHESDEKKSCWLISKVKRWKIVICSLFINILLSCPVYIFGITLNCNRDWYSLWPPITFNSIYLILIPWMFNPESWIYNFSSRYVALSGAVITSFGLCLSGLLMLASSHFFSIVFYGIIGGLGTCIVMAKVWNILSTHFSTNDLHLINVIYSSGQALSQLVLPLIITSFRINYGSEMAVFLMGAIIMHTLPFVILITQKIAKYTSIEYRKNNQPFDESRYSDLATAFTQDIDLNLEINMNDLRESTELKLITKEWKNPGLIYTGIDRRIEFERTSTTNIGHMKIINSDGVEILEAIPEEEEEGYVTSSNSSSIDRNSIVNAYEEINRKMGDKRKSKVTKFDKFFMWIQYKYDNVSDVVHQEFINPLKRSLTIYKFYPAVFLKSNDIFLYILCITSLPCIARQIHQANSGEVISLVALTALPKFTISVLSIWLEDAIKMKQKHWHTVGEICKLVGCLAIAFSRTRFFLRTGCLSLGFGQGVSFLLQDRVLRREFTSREWSHIRGSIYSISGCLLIIYTLFTTLVLISTDYKACMYLAALLYFIALFLWLSVPYYKNWKNVILTFR